MYNQHNETREGGCNIRPRLFLGESVSPKQLSGLENLGFDVKVIPTDPLLAKSVRTHPDMLICKAGDRLVMTKDYYEKNASCFEGVPVTTTQSTYTDKYPGDVILNALIIGDTVYGRVDVICQEILDTCPRHVLVKQGYAACSCAKIADRAVITADKSLASALKNDGIDVCVIDSGNILLEGYGYGFIGGASVKLDNETVAFFGKIEDHPCYDQMRKFADDHGVSLISLSDEPLTDCGGGFLW